MKITVINGVNLNMLGSRDKAQYGGETLSDIEVGLKKEFPEVSFVFKQSNIEGELVNFLQEAGKTAGGVVLNAGAYSHYSLAIADACRDLKIPVVEVHLSNIFAREEFRATSVISPAAKGIISGFGAAGYALAVRALLRREYEI